MWDPCLLGVKEIFTIAQMLPVGQNPQIGKSATLLSTFTVRPVKSYKFLPKEFKSDTLKFKSITSGIHTMKMLFPSS